MFKKFLFAALILIPVVAPAAEVSSDFDRDRDLSEITTYQFAIPAMRHPMDALAFDELADKRIRNALRDGFASVGLRETKGQPDVLIVYYATVVEKQKVTTQGFGPRGLWRETARTEDYVDGTGAIEMLDAFTGEVIWRGRVRGTITLDNVEKRTKAGMRRLANAFAKDRSHQAKQNR